MDFLKSAVAAAIAKGGSSPYTLGDRIDSGDSLWTLHNATKKEDGSTCSVFTFDITTNRSRLPLARNAMRKFRTLRHPGVIRVLDTVETESHITIVTERVVPLSWLVKRRSISEETAKWGLYMVSSTLKFINQDASSIHGAVRVSSVFTSESGEWKLGGFDILSSMNDDEAVIYKYGSLLPDSARYSPPEINKGGWDTIRKHPLAAVDAYGLGTLIYEVFNGAYNSGDQTKTTSIPPSMQQSYKRLGNPNPKLRVSPANFVEQGKKIGGFFQTTLIKLTDDIESLGLKDETERDAFINELDNLSDDFPEDFFKLKVLPELLKSVEFGGGGPKVLGAILKIGSKLSDDEYASKLTPVVVRLFANPDRAIRVCLLDNLPLMIDRLPQKIVNDKIFPQMTSGFTDIAPVVREQSVKAVLMIITKLSDRTINGELLRFLARTANDDQPGIRTNTTICLGKIARNLGQSTRSKVLIAAFSRSIRDPFVHARNAALLAFAATIEYFSEEDCANKIMPAICPALLDKEKLVRDQANKTLDAYIHRVRKHSNTMADTILPPPEAADTHQNAARIGTSNDTSWAGWAISSFTNKLTTARGDIQPTTNGKTPATIELVRSSSIPRSPHASATERLGPPQSSLSVAAPPLARSSSDRPASAVSEPDPSNVDDWGVDAWGALDDQMEDKDEDTFFDATTSRGVSPCLDTTPVPAPAVFDDGGEPDFAGWLAAQSKAKAKKPLPRSLSKATSNKDVSSRGVGGATKTGTNPLSTTQSKSKAPSSKISMKPKDEAGDDGWGDAW